MYARPSPPPQPPNPFSTFLLYFPFLFSPPFRSSARVNVLLLYIQAFLHEYICIDTSCIYRRIHTRFMYKKFTRDHWLMDADVAPRFSTPPTFTFSFHLNREPPSFPRFIAEHIVTVVVFVQLHLSFIIHPGISFIDPITCNGRKNIHSLFYLGSSTSDTFFYRNLQRWV